MTISEFLSTYVAAYKILYVTLNIFKVEKLKTIYN